MGAVLHGVGEAERGGTQVNLEISGLVDKVVLIFKTRGKEALDALSPEDRKAALESVALIAVYQGRVLIGDKPAEELLRREGKTLRGYGVIAGIQLDKVAGEALKDVLGAALGVAVSLLAGLI